uniref:G_PROTEIN_RECEP_F1_2 domain-containing protein n=1 Tax=Parastrongyloides trichosuri TaxID=131310 RepID=A0A0N4ZYK9_PARTI
LLCCLAWLPGVIHAFWRTLCNFYISNNILTSLLYQLSLHYYPHYK